MDLHVHVGPEFLARRYDPFTIAEEAHEAGFGCVLKNHFVPTTSLAAQARLHRPVTILGSVTLNYTVGGLNPQAIRAAQSTNKTDHTKACPDPMPFVVWMPTIHAESHLAHNDRLDMVPGWGVDERYCQFFPPGTGITIWGPGGADTELLPAIYDIFDLIKAYDLILATGHLSGPEVKVLVKKAYEQGLRRIIVTHPFFGATELSTNEQAALAELDGVYIEHCYSNLQMDRIPIERYVEAIRAVTPSRVILSSDLGQLHTPPVAEGLDHFMQALQAHGVCRDDLLVMLVENPHRLIGNTRASG